MPSPISTSALPSAVTLYPTDTVVVNQSDGTKKMLMSLVVSGTVYNAGNISGSVTMNLDHGVLQSATITAPLTLTSPIGTLVLPGQYLTLWLTSSGTQTLNLSGILTPSDSGVVFPKTLTSGKLYIIRLVYNGAAWMLISTLGGY